MQQVLKDTTELKDWRVTCSDVMCRCHETGAKKKVTQFLFPFPIPVVLSFYASQNPFDGNRVKWEREVAEKGKQKLRGKEPDITVLYSRLQLHFLHTAPYIYNQHIQAFS